MISVTTDNSTSIPKSSGIYRISNLHTGDCYIGQASNLQKRRHNHLSDLRKQQHGNQRLQRAWNKYGASAFLYAVIEICPIESLTEREDHWMNWCRERGIELYNMCPAAGSVLGLKHSKESRDKHSENAKRYMSNPNTRARLRESSKRQWLNPEFRIFRSQSAKKQMSDPEMRKRLSDASKIQMSSPEMRARIIAANKNRIVSSETRHKRSMSLSKLRYMIFDAQGKEYAVRNMSQFCLNFGLSNGTMNRVIHGNLPHFHHYTGRMMTSNEALTYEPLLSDAAWIEINPDSNKPIQLPLFTK